MYKFSIPQRKSIRSKPSQSRSRSKRSKFVLGILIVVTIGSFIFLILPYLPRLRFLITRPKIDASPYQQAAIETKQGKKPEKPVPENLKGNRIILAPIGINAQIIEGKNIYVIGKNQGAWRETPNANPTKPSNIVLAGHRFLYTAANGGVFYNLPELKNGNKIYLKWDDKVYEYEIYNTRTVLPTQVDIRDPDPTVPNKLTLYTCYPLGSTAKRFVVEAKQL